MLLKHKPALGKRSIGIMRSLASEDLVGQESFIKVSYGFLWAVCNGTCTFQKDPSVFDSPTPKSYLQNQSVLTDFLKYGVRRELLLKSSCSDAIPATMKVCHSTSGSLP